jgi:serine/threonine protein kinase
VGQTHTTTTGLVRGTPSYMAPETWEGDRSFGPTVDMFALGCILWEMTMLRCLFDGDTIPQVYGAVAYGEPAQEVSPIAERHPGLAPILGKLLQRDPGLRLGDAKQLVAALVTQRGECLPGPDLQEFLASFRPTRRLKEELPEAEQLVNLATSPETAETSERSLGLRILVLVAVGLAGLWILWGGTGDQHPGNPEGAVPPPAVSFQPTESVVVPGPPSDSLGEDEVERGDSDSSRETLPRDSRISAASSPAESPAAESRAADESPAAEGRPDARSGAGKAAARRLAEPSTSPDARSRSESGPAVKTVAPAAAEVATPAEVSPSSSEACLVLTSSPGGAQVWLNSKLSQRVARSRARRGDHHPPGAVEVSMGGRSPKARVEVELRAGEATKVHCSVGADARCTVSSVSGAYCDD